MNNSIVQRIFIREDKSEVTFAFYRDWRSKSAIMTYSFDADGDFDLQYFDNVDIDAYLDLQYTTDFIATIGDDDEDLDHIIKRNREEFTSHVAEFDEICESDFEAPKGFREVFYQDLYL